MGALSPSLAEVQARAAGLSRLLEEKREDIRKSERRAAKLQHELDIAPAVEHALDQLSERMFEQITGALEKHLTEALQEVLGQPLKLKARREYTHKKVRISFAIERAGNEEDIMRAQGGSVVNVLSVGLRFFALCSLPESEHARFIVLDEQDCWLRPDLVSSLVKIVHDAGRGLGFQVLMISHHDVEVFDRYADRIYELIPGANGVTVKRRGLDPEQADGDAPEEIASGGDLFGDSTV